MKKIIFLVAVLFSAVCLNAQSFNAKIGTDTTLAVAGTKTYSVTVTGAKKNITFQTNVTKNSGTVAGTIVLKGSIDGGTTYATLASHTLTDASAVWLDTYAYNPCQKYQVVVTTTGTSSTTWQVWALYR
jgi:predicted secreted protein